MRTGRRAEVLIVAGLVLLLALLAIGIGSLQFLPGQPFSLGSLSPAPGANQAAGPVSTFTIDIVRFIFLFALAGIPLVIIYAIVSPEIRRKLIANLVAVGIMALMFYLFLNGFQRGEQTIQPNAPAVQATPAETATAPPGVKFNPNLPDSLVITVSLIVAVLVFGLIGFMLWRAWRNAHPARDDSLDALANQAQDALNSLRSGGDLRDVVLRCYREMSRELQQERGLWRQPAMTAREFERALQDKGVPQQPVRQLTELFEQVRYGHESMGAQAEADASASLDALVSALRAARPEQPARQTS